MNDTLSDFPALLERCRSGIAAIFRQANERAQWAGSLAELLGQLVPSAAWTACLLKGEGAVCVAVRPHEGDDQSERERLLQSQLSSFDALANGVAILPVETQPDYRILVAAIQREERPRGFLIIAFPHATSQQEAADAEALLTAAAPTVAQCWTVQTLLNERVEWERFALLGHAFTGLAHELNNILNGLMLQTSMVQLRADPQMRQELATIRQYGAQAAELLRSLQQVVHQRREEDYPVDLEGVLAEILEENATLRRLVSLRSSANPSCIQSTRGAVKQFLRLVLEGVCSKMKTTVNAATQTHAHGVALTLTVAVANLGSEGDDSVLEAMLWQNLDEVGRHAGQALLRQLGGSLTAEYLGGDSAILRIVWK